MKPGPLIPMPSVALELGKYVTLRRRKDGTYRVLLEVPARLRPSGWSAAIPLPINGARTGDLSDLGEVARIRDDAQALYVRLQQAKLGGPAPEATGRDFPRLIREWQTSQGFKAKKPRTQQGYAYHASLIFDWSAANGHRAVSGLPRDAIEAFLALYDDRPTTRRHVKIVLKMLLDHAIALGWRSDNPAERIKMAAPESQLTIWEWEDARREAWACALAGQPSIAAMILTNWEIGQRVTDLRLFRRGGEYDARQGLFRFWQSKTRAHVTVPVSDDLRALLDTVAPTDSLYLFTDAATGKPWAEQRLGHVFAAIRTRSDLQLRSLRHSCVVQQARAGCTVPEIASVTGHSPFSVEQILRKYLPRDNQVAWNAQRKRGLIRTDRAQESDGHPTLESDGQSAATAK